MTKPNDAQATQAASPKQAEPAGWKSLSDCEWVNIVNAPSVLDPMNSKDDAVAEAFKLIEAKLREKNAGTHPAEPADWSGRVIEVFYETHRAVIRYEGDHPEINQAVYLATPQQAVSAQELSDEQISLLWMEAHHPHRAGSSTGNTRVKRFARAAIAAARAQQAPQASPKSDEPLDMPENDEAHEAWVSACEVDGVKHSGSAFERGWELALSNGLPEWPTWASQILKIVREHSGYDGFDDADGVDLVEETRECLGELAAMADRARSELKAAPQALEVRDCIEYLNDCFVDDDGRLTLTRDRIVETLQAFTTPKSPQAVESQGQVQKGWKLVPIEPTMEMLAAGYENREGPTPYAAYRPSEVGAIYQDMIAAAPDRTATPAGEGA
jgi:hypothetical protein